MAEDKSSASEKVLTVSSSPHVGSPATTKRIMYEVAMAMVPCVVMSLWLFRLPALYVVLASVVGALASEAIFNAVRGRKHTFLDGSALVTGLILGLSLPPSLPWWMAVVGSVMAIVIAKMLFGGLGSNVFNPAMVGRTFLMACFGTMMTTWAIPASHRESMPVPSATGYVDAVTTATPLALAKQAIKDAHNPDIAAEKKASPHALNGQWQDMFMGNISGSLGETSAALWLLGGLYLLGRRIITWHVPAGVLGSAALITFMAWKLHPEVFASPLVHLSSGGLMMCAFFIATDPVTCPLSKLGRFIFGVGVGSLIMLIRLKGGYPEGVMYAVLLMNAITPLLDRWTRPTPLGGHVHAK